MALKKRKIVGWVHISEACEQFGFEYEDLRVLVRNEIFSRGRFTSQKRCAPIFLSLAELRAYRRGGVDAVRRVQKRAARNGRK